MSSLVVKKNKKSNFNSLNEMNIELIRIQSVCVRACVFVGFGLKCTSATKVLVSIMLFKLLIVHCKHNEFVFSA